MSNAVGRPCRRARRIPEVDTRPRGPQGRRVFIAGAFVFGAGGTRSVEEGGAAALDNKRAFPAAEGGVWEGKLLYARATEPAKLHEAWPAA